MTTPSLEDPTRAWHALDLPSVLQLLKATEEGLSQTDAESRLERYGPNSLPSPQPPPFWKVAVRQFQSPLIYILGAAAGISVLIQELTDAAFIAGVLVLNATIGSYQEWKAERSSHALQKFLQIRAAVQRGGRVREIEAERLVPGDVVWLESGNRVPADVRLLSSRGFEVDESLLTGESLPVLKDPSWKGPETTALGDRLNMAFAGSSVARGWSKAVVVSTGMFTVVGQLARDVVATTGGKPPLLIRMERFTKVVAAAVLTTSLAIGSLGVFAGRYDISETFLFIVALAVSAIPEGLPVAITVALSIATTRMARRGVIVRRLTAVEGLGSCTFVGTDKTGTLTVNELTIRRICLASGPEMEVTGEGFAPVGSVHSNGQPVKAGANPDLDRLARAAVLSNEAELFRQDGDWVGRGDAVDIAMLSMAGKLGWQREATLERHPQVNEIPFEPEHQFAASYHRVSDGVSVFVKGSPERVLGMCGFRSDKQTGDLLELAESMAGQGFRVLALADGTSQPGLEADDAPPTPSGLSFLGFVGMIDPLRPGVREAIQACGNAGVAVSMITGDHPVTALSIARDLGLASNEDEVLTGAALLEVPATELPEIVGRIRVFARVSPRQKLLLVKAARDADHFVAVTGDGVNDAPALRSANIGVAMGRGGTDVTRDAADLVVSDDNFASIVNGIEVGRVAYDNIRKVIYLLVSTGAAELVLVALSVVVGHPLPLLPVQLLWLNLVTNGIQDVALAFEKGEGDALRRKPREPDEPVFDRLMIERTVVGALVGGVVGFGAFDRMLEAGYMLEDARNTLLLLMVLFENFHIANCRSETRSAFSISPLRSPILVGGAITAFLVHVGSMHLPLGQLLLGTRPLPLGEWLLPVLLAFSVVPAIEIHKWSWARRQRGIG